MSSGSGFVDHRAEFLPRGLVDLVHAVRLFGMGRGLRHDLVVALPANNLLTVQTCRLATIELSHLAPFARIDAADYRSLASDLKSSFDVSTPSGMCSTRKR